MVDYKDFVSRRVLLALLTFLVVGTTVGSFLTGGVKTTIGTHPFTVAAPQIAVGHRIFHFICFGSIALSALLLSAGFSDELRAILCVALHGTLIEIAQRLFHFWRLYPPPSY